MYAGDETLEASCLRTSLTQPRCRFDNWTKGDIATASPTRRQSNRQSGCPGQYALQLRCKWRSRPQSGKASQLARLSKRDNVVRTRKPIYLKHLPTAGDSLTLRLCTSGSHEAPDWIFTDRPFEGTEQIRVILLGGRRQVAPSSFAAPTQQTGCMSRSERLPGISEGASARK